MLMTTITGDDESSLQPLERWQKSAHVVKTRLLTFIYTEEGVDYIRINSSDMQSQYRRPHLYTHTFIQIYSYLCSRFSHVCMCKSFN